jgi:voltage-dependent calcium channel L type alpha-1D
LVEEQENKSLYLFSNTQAFRIFCIKISESHWFENFILLMISISSVALAFENPLNDPEGRMVFALKILDFVSTAIFTIEVFVKVVARGFYFNG